MAWLVCGDRVMASLEVASGAAQRRRGLLGRDHIDGALLLERTRSLLTLGMRLPISVHTLGMRFPIDVAHCDSQMRVLKVSTMRPNRIGLPVRRAAAVIEAEAGAFERWGVRPGAVLEVRE